MKRCIWTILILAMATYTWAATSPSMQRILATSPKVTVNPATAGAKARIFVAYTTGAGAQFRVAETDSVLALGGLDTTAPDGTRFVNPGNTTACPPDGPPLSICTLPTGVKWYGTVTGVTDWHPVGGASTLSGITDWPSGVSAIEAGFLDGVTSPIQAQIDGVVAGSSGFLATPPAYSDTPCTKGQWSTDGTNHYDCVATNTWEAFAYGTNPLTAAPSFATINTVAKTAGQYSPGTGISAPDTTNSYYYYTSITALETGAIVNAHWNMYSNGVAAASEMEIYSSDGSTLVCATSPVTGSASSNQAVDTTMAGCTVSSGTTYLVGICVTADGSTTNGPYVQNTTGGSTKRVQIPCDGSSFNSADTGTNISVSATRSLYVWGDNSATR